MVPLPHTYNKNYTVLPQKQAKNSSSIRGFSRSKSPSFSIFLLCSCVYLSDPFEYYNSKSSRLYINCKRRKGTLFGWNLPV